MYNLVFPRDAFNAANYFKCVGKLYLQQLEKPDCQWWKVVAPNAIDGDTFSSTPELAIRHQDGAMHCPEIRLECRETGREFDLYIPCNSRNAWPMWADDDDDDIELFDTDGNIIAESP